MQNGLFDLTGRTALVTGAGRGIGLTLAEGLARQGADVALVARTRNELEAANEQVEGQTGRRVWVFPFDLAGLQAMGGCSTRSSRRPAASISW